MKQLLEKIKIIDFKYQVLNRKEKFNLFTILRKYNDEVNLHSRFINELLNPKGSHDLGDTFLKLFFEAIGYDKYIISDKTEVYCEKYIGKINSTKTEGGQIDLLIENIGKHHIVIENKIHAEDQLNQLLRYNNYKENGVIYYLTLYGTEPSPKSLGTLSVTEINCISYKNEIRNWIQLCIEKTSLNPELRESLVQYLDLINKLIGETSNMEERKEIIELLSKDNNIFPASIIASNWVHVKWHTEYDFWIDFENTIKSSSQYEIIDVQKYSPDNITSVVHKSRNKNPWYGIMLRILNLNGVDFCIFIERGWNDLYYGLLMLDSINSKRINNSDLMFIKLSNRIKGISDWENETWLGASYLEPKINLEHFNNKNTLMLVDENYRKDYIKNNWKRIEEFIEKCLQEIAAINQGV